MADKSAGWLALVGTGGAIFGATVTGGFNYLSHRGDLDAKMIELSVGILRSEPRPETEPLREWAIDVISKRARFEFDGEQRSVLLKKELPFKGVAEAQYEYAKALELLSASVRETKQEDLDTAFLKLKKMLEEENERKKQEENERKK